MSDDYWREYRVEAARSAILEVNVDDAVREMRRSAADIREWAAWHVERGAEPRIFSDMLRIASFLESRADDYARHRERFAELLATYEFGKVAAE